MLDIYLVTYTTKIELSANFEITHGVGKFSMFRRCTEFGHCATIGTDIHVDWSDTDVEYFINKSQPLEY